MKLKLPLALLTSLFTCIASAQEETTYKYTQIPEGTIPVYEKVTGDAANGYTVKIEGDYSTSWYVNAEELTWTQCHDYTKGLPINVGSALTKSIVNIVTPEGAEEKTVVSTGANLFIGCPGWGITASEVYKPQTGIVNVEKDATLIVGKGNNDTSNTQLNVGAGVSHSQYGHEGILNVNGGVVRAGCVNVACGYEDVKGTLNITDGGTVIAENRGNNTGLFVLGYYADASGTVNISGGSTLKAEYYTMVGYGRDGGHADGTLNVSEDSKVELGSYLFAGREQGSTGTVTVDSSTLTAGTTYLGYAADTTGKVSLSSGATAEISGTTNIGYNGGDGAFSVSSGSSATFADYVMVGGWNGSSGELTVSDGGTADINSALYLGYSEGTSGEASVSGLDSNLTVAGTSFVGYSGAGTLSIAEGAEVNAAGQLVIGCQANSTACVVVDGTGSNLTAGGTTFLGYSENSGSLSLTNGASADLQYVQATGTSTVSITGGSTAKVGSGIDGMYIGENARLIVEDGATAASSLQVEGILGNEGTLQANLSQGGSVSALAVENTGTMEVTLDKGAEFSSTLDVSNSGTMTVSVVDGSFKALEVNNLENGTLTVTVGNGASYEAATVNNSGTMDIELKEGATMVVDAYVNAGNSTITAAEGTTCQISSLDLSGGSMKLDGDGEFNLGGSAEGESGLSSTFHVSGFNTTTNIDISSLVSESVDNLKFTINNKSVFTLNFTAKALANIKEGEKETFELTLVAGYEGFSVEEGTLSYLLDNNTRYVFETALAFAADASAGAADYVVEEAQYRMVGNDLVWTGTVKGIPEPTTATLSLLALAALAARRRRRCGCAAR